MEDMNDFCKKIRLQVLDNIYLSKQSHIASCFSVIEILAILYLRILNISPLNLKDPTRDRFLLSKGHAALALYSVLSELNFFDKSLMDTFCENNSNLIGHVSHYVPGVEFSTGSLGHALSVGCGLAIASKRAKKSFLTYVLLSDGELQEGANWEAIMFAGVQKLGNLIAVVDYNKIQSLGRVEDICDLNPLSEKFRAFKWDVLEVDGHSCSAIEQAFRTSQTEKPKVIIAHTVKGKGVSFMENKLKWHYKNPNKEEYESAKNELISKHATNFCR